MLVMKSVESELRLSVMVVEDRPSWPGGCPPGLCTVTSLCPTSVSPRHTQRHILLSSLSLAWTLDLLAAVMMRLWSCSVRKCGVWSG